MNAADISRISDRDGGAECYTTAFHQEHQEGSRTSAEKIVPLVLELIQPRSVVDVGCGVGTWLRVFVDHGITDVCGVDGDYVDRASLQIDRNQFIGADLTKPFRLDRRFDLVLCLEVAEHIEEEFTPSLIDILVSLGPVILFSAAIPYQGGTHHVNEHWPQYWTDQFQARRYVPVDVLRTKIWQTEGVAWWYAQNAVLFVEQSYLEGNTFLLSELDRGNSRSPLPVVHPKKYLDVVFHLRLAQDGAATVPPGGSFVLVDDFMFGVEAIPGRSGLPFLEHEGMFCGRPIDDDQAIKELERMRSSGLGFIIFSWLSFWWLEYYRGFDRYLRSNFRCVREAEYMIAFDLRETTPCSAAASRHG